MPQDRPWAQWAKSSQMLAAVQDCAGVCGWPTGRADRGGPAGVPEQGDHVACSFLKRRLDGRPDEDRPGRPPSDTVDQDVVIATLEETPRRATHWPLASMSLACNTIRPSERPCCAWTRRVRSSRCSPAADQRFGSLLELQPWASWSMWSRTCWPQARIQRLRSRWQAKPLAYRRRSFFCSRQTRCHF